MNAKQESQIRQWCHQEQVRLCILFGSRATGKARSDSDIDLAIWPKRPFTPRQKLIWVVDLEKLLAQNISLVLVSAALDPVLGWEIAKNGRLLFEQTSGLWLHHRAQLWHSYNDSLPFRRAARKRLRDFADKVRLRNRIDGI